MRTVHPLVLLVALALLYGCSGGDEPEQGSSDEVDPVAGRELYAQNCAVCHGEQAQGTSEGPPLVHELYVPSHHADESFQAAVARGVQPHHWEFGPMPPIQSLARPEVADIIAHVRQLQADAGLVEAGDG